MAKPKLLFLSHDLTTDSASTQNYLVEAGGASEATGTLWVKNIGTAAASGLTVSFSDLTAGFSQFSTTCGDSLAVNAICSINIDYIPVIQTLLKTVTHTSVTATIKTTDDSAAAQTVLTGIIADAAGDHVVWPDSRQDFHGLYFDSNSGDGGIIYHDKEHNSLWSLSNHVQESTDGGVNFNQVFVLPEDVEATSFNTQANMAFLGTTDGLYYSDDGGATWSTENYALSGKLVYSITSNGSTIFAATDGGIYRSLDGGITWSEEPIAFPDSQVPALAIHGGKLYAIVSTFMASGLRAQAEAPGLYVSNDNGTTWQLSTLVLKLGYIAYSLHSVGAHLYVSTVGSEGLHKKSVRYGADIESELSQSTNGVSWHTVETGAHVVNDMAKLGDTLYAGTASGMLMSNNNGLSWQVLNSTLHNNSNNSLQNINGKLYVQNNVDLFKLNEEEGSATWQPVASVATANLQINGVTSTENVVTLATNSGLYEGDASQGELKPLGLYGINVKKAMPIGVDGSFVALGKEDGLYVSEDGKIWPTSATAFAENEVNFVHKLNDRFYAGVRASTSTLAQKTSSQQLAPKEKGLYETASLKTWDEADNVFPDVEPLSVATYDSKLFVGLSGVGEADSGLYENKEGAEFTEVGKDLLGGAPVSHLLVTADGGALVAGTGAGSFRSADGVDWTKMGNLDDDVMNQLVNGPYLILFAATNKGLFES